MKNNKLTYLIALLLFFSLLNLSCSGKKKDNRITVTFWHSFVSSTIPALNELIARFEKEHPDIRINAQYVPTGDALVQKLITSIQSNTAPDISWLHADFLDQLSGSGAIYDINTFIKGKNGLSDPDMTDIFPQLIKTFTRKDTLYAIPMEATTLALLYNKDEFKAAGLDPNHPPATWQELEDYALKLTRDKDGDGIRDQYGFYIPSYPASGPLSIWMVLQWTPYLWQAGGDVISPDQSHVLYNSEAGVKALTLWRDIYKKLNFGSYSFSHDMGFASGSLAMIMDGPWDLPTFRKMNNIHWAVAPLPAGPSGSATYIAGEGLAIFKQSKNADAAWTFIKWVSQPENQAFFSMKSGYLPIRKSVLDREDYKAFLEKDNAMKKFVEQIAIARQRPAIDKYYININQHIAEAIERTIMGNVDPQKALNDAAEKSNTLLRNKK